ncbi:phosphopentomutase [Secundilactobacillus odoratitofui DSM 19909 = JCM 15043]|uniref:Phosphopentomutase n=1 Tax=Secundilactobacillus odoratitofui DSM 19909 = JCM 15043 TaxID=1423776 RepID=A0A0R1LRL7_9LACO|nr:phosphopentomutase [Secundilactobacillus odoratitofui]KRK98469.1 phosphopentomutase [Secundilactobacillus odoratitofui DSM 19909 = JCM 15043]
MTFKRVFGIVIDSVGIGEASDANQFGDVGADTLGHIGEHFQGKLKLPNLEKMGLSNIRPDNPIEGVAVVDDPIAYFGKMHETSVGKDSMDGHWEMMGLPVTEPLGFFPEGFPAELIKQLEDFSGRHVIVNKPYSGTDVIHDYGEHQMATGDLIVYTSGDSVLQIAAHEDVIPLEELYRICEYARSITIDQPYRIGRIIARPYVGPDKDHFTRTANRHDFALEPTGETDMDRLKAAGLDVLAVGKINDIFSGHGITEGVHTESNEDGMNKTIENAKKSFNGFSFTNLVDFDAMYGHRRNPEGYGQALMAFDQQLGDFLTNLTADDLVIITADHGNDPGFKGTDHTREYVPLIAYSPSFKHGKSLGIRRTYADFGATVLENFGVSGNQVGTSFLSELTTND